MRQRLFNYCINRALWHSDAERLLRSDLWFILASLFDTGKGRTERLD